MLALVPIIAVMLIAVSALAVDWGRIQLARGQLRTATDAAVLAGIDGRMDSAATDRAIAVASKNMVMGKPAQVSSGDITFGKWDARTRTFSTGKFRPNAMRIHATATVDLMFGAMLGRSQVQISATSTATARPGAGGLIGLDSADLNGAAAIDSYDSTVAGYASSKAQNASVMSNGPIVLGGSTVVSGDAQPGVGMNPASGGQVTGTRQPIDFVLEYPPVASSEYSGWNDNIQISTWLNASNDFVFNSGVANIPAGEYAVRNLDLGGSATLNLLGPVTFYVTGRLTSHGRFTTADSTPENLKIRVASTGSVYITGNTSFYGNIYAPQSSVEMTGSADYYGNFVGRTMKVGGSANVHDDEGGRSPMRGTSLVE